MLVFDFMAVMWCFQCIFLGAVQRRGFIELDSSCGFSCSSNLAHLNKKKPNFWPSYVRFTLKPRNITILSLILQPLGIIILILYQHLYNPIGAS